jgi:MoaA/NifB/PqqE/SkfB family radical SAM enzyme
MNDFERLLMYYGAGRVFIPMPRFFIYNATYRCDLLCKHCGVWETKKREELSPADLEKILARKFFDKVETAWVTGGEPTMRSDLDGIAGALGKNFRKMSVLGMASNGYATGRIMERLEQVMARLDRARHGIFLQLSIDGIGEAHDRVRGKKGAFDALRATVDAVRKFMEANRDWKITLGFNCVIQPENVIQLEQVRAYAKENRSEITFNLVQVTDQFFCNQHSAAALGFKKEEKQEIIKFLNKLVQESGPAFSHQYQWFRSVLEGKPRPRRCLNLYSTFIVDSDGTWIPCPLCSEWERVSFLETEPEAFWKSAKAAELRRRAEQEKCPQCMLGCSLGDSLSISEFLAGGAA